jgi:mannosyltransferase
MLVSPAPILRRPSVFLCALCVCSFGLAVLQLDRRHLWGDEAFSVWASTASVASLVAGLDAQPPLYHLLLKLARALWGESVFAIRYASAGFGVLLIPTIFRAARAAIGVRGAAIAALLLAISPMLSYFQQEARMYTLAALLTAIAFGQVARALAGRHLSRAGWLAYVAASIGALYSHFFTVAVLAVCSVALGVQALRRAPGIRIRTWLAAHSAIALGFGAWFFGRQWAVLAKAVAAPGAAGARMLPPPWQEVQLNIMHGFSALATGMRHELWHPSVLIGVLAMTIIGAALLLRRARAVATVTLCGAVVVLTCALVFVTASRSGVIPDFNPRYLLFMLPALAVLIGGWGAHRLTALFGLSMLTTAALIGHVALASPNWQKSRYAELIDVLRARGKADDLTVFLNSDQAPLLRYYGPAGTREFMMSNALWAPERTAALLSDYAQASNGASRVWLVKYGFASAPGVLSPIERQLQQQNALRVYSGEFGDATLLLYQSIDANRAASLRAINAHFGGQLTLLSMRTPDQIYRPGDAIPLTFEWRADAQLSADYTVFVHLRQANSAAQIQANDSVLRADGAATAGWDAGRVVVESRGIQIPEDAAPGTYRVVIGLYQYPSFERLLVGNGPESELEVLQVQVQP